MWNISEVTNPNGAKTLYKYNKDNRLSEIVDALGDTTYFNYDLNGNCLSEERCEVNSKFEYDAVGRKTKIFYLNGTSCEYVYDVFNNIIEMTIGDDIKVQMSYDESNHLIEQKNSEGEIRRFTYTEDGKVSSVVDEFNRKTQYQYIPGENKYASIIYPDGNVEKFSYDIAGNLVEHIDRAGNIVTAKYDSSNQLIQSYVNDKLMSTITYDSMGNIINITDADGNLTKYEYSLKNELIRLTNAEGSVIEYSYDMMGHLLTKTDIALEEKRITNFEYDLLGRIVKTIDPLGNIESFKYDCFDNLISKIDKDGINTQYEYTNTGKVSKISYDDGRIANLLYDKHDYLQEIKDWTGITRISNDLSGRALSVEYPNGESVSYTYNSAGKRTSISYPSGSRTEYQYDDLLRLEVLTSDDVSIKYLYDKSGRLEKKVSSVGIDTQYTYNEQGLLHSYSNLKGNELLDKVEIEYDIFNRKSKISKMRSDEQENSGEYSYTYDDLGRLKSVTRDGILQTVYGYDSFGNRVSKIEEGEETKYQYNELNQLISVQNHKNHENYKYDKRGNLISVESKNGCERRYEYGSINRLEKVVNHRNGRTTNYQYNALGYRMSKNITGDNYSKNEDYCIDMTKQYDNLLQMRKDGNLQHFVWDDKLVAINSSKQSYYCMLDDLGSPYRMVNNDGRTIETYNYDEFGVEKTKRCVDINPFTFIGYLHDGESQFYYAQAREYMPMAGRFAARDLVGGSVDSIDSQNDYLYCEDDPNNFVDKNGLFLVTAIVVGIAVGAATSGGVNFVKQTIDIKRGKQKDYKWGELAGSAVEGAIVGGVSAIPGLGPVAGVAAKTAAGGVGAAANSLISQKIDDGKIDGGKVAEDTVAGAIFGFISSGPKAAKDAITKAPKSATETIYANYKNAKGSLTEAEDYLYDVLASDHTPSSLTRRAYESARKEVSDLTKKYFKTWGKSKVSSTLKDLFKTTLGYKSVKSIAKESFKKWLPWYSDGEDDVLEYVQDYYGTLYGKVTGKCPIYA